MEKFSQVFVRQLKPGVFSTTRRCFAEGVSSPPISKSAAVSKNLGDVPGLSAAVVKTPSGVVGPGASKSAEYKNPEYFSYNNTSYYEAEIEMSKFRLPQPSNRVPYTNAS